MFRASRHGGHINPRRAEIRSRKLFARRLASGGWLDNAFLNYEGNYTVKRQPRPATAPLPPSERFNRLAAHFLSCAMIYRNPPAFRDKSNQRHKSLSPVRICAGRLRYITNAK